MKTVFIWMLISLVSCSSVSNATKELILPDVSGENHVLSKNFSYGKVDEFTLYGNQATVFALELSSVSEAKEYAMERRLILLKKFESIIEPYFGTANAVKCRDNIRSSILHKDENSLTAVLQLLSLGEERVLNDCLTETNTHWLRVEMLVCGNVFYDIRTYQPISQGALPYETFFNCP